MFARRYFINFAFALGIALAFAVFVQSDSSRGSLSDFLRINPEPAPNFVSSISVHFDLCGDGVRINCVVDGDTLWVGGEKIRIADIDTPEVFSPSCASEKRLGEQATVRLIALINAGPMEIASYTPATDRYGRALRILQRDGRSLGGMLVAEGLARKWEGARHSWCA